jgi:hypothetical protein
MSLNVNDWLFSEKELNCSPSILDGNLTLEQELLLRARACRFIEKLCKTLELPKLSQMSASTYLHRFYMRQSIEEVTLFLVATSCVLLGAKVEETPLKQEVVAKKYISLLNTDNKGRQKDLQVIAKQIIEMESLVLHVLVYDLALVHPYVFINEKVDKIINLNPSKIQANKLKQIAWSLLNDSVVTRACLRFEPEQLAVGAVYLAGLYENYVTSMSSKPTKWWRVLKTPWRKLQDAAKCLLEVYQEPYLKAGDKLPPGLARLVDKMLQGQEDEDDTDCKDEEELHDVTSPECGSVHSTPSRNSH